VADFRVDAHEFSRLMREVKDFDAKLATAIRKELRQEGKRVAAKVADEVRTGPPPNDNPRVTAGTRRRIADGIGVSIGTGMGKKGGSVRIVASGKALPANRKRMVRLWEREKGWRHPVYERGRDGNLTQATQRRLRNRFKKETVWTHQMGRPYFNPTVRGEADEFRAAILRAMKQAADALARRMT
jgi:hypothetical protein